MADLDPEIAAALDDPAPFDAPPPAPPPEPANAAEWANQSLLSPLAEGATFGRLGEIANTVGTVVGGFGGVPRAQGRGPDAPLMSRGDRARQFGADLQGESERGLARARADMPIASTITELAGGAATAALPGNAVRSLAGAVAPTMVRAVAASPRLTRMAQLAEATGVGALEAQGRGQNVAVGAGLGLAGGELGNVAGKSIAALPDAGRRVASRIADLIGDAESKSAATIPLNARPFADALSRVDIPKTAGDYVPAGTAARTLARRGASNEVLEQHARAVGAGIDEMETMFDKITADESVGTKLPLVQRYMKEEQMVPDEVIDASDGVWEGIRERFDQLVSDVGNGEGAATLKRLKRQAFDAFEHASDSSPSYKTAADRFMALDAAKRTIQKTIARIPNGEVRHALKDEIEPAIRGMLEDPEIWGYGATTLQKVRNESWRNYLLMAEASDSPARKWLSDATGTGRYGDAYKLKLKHNAAGVINTLKDASGYLGRADADRMIEWASRKANLLDALTKHPSAPQAEKQMAARARQIVDEIRSRVASRASEGEMATALESMIAAPQLSPSLKERLAAKLPWVGEAIKEATAGGHGARARELALAEAAPAGNTYAAGRIAAMRNAQVAKDRIGQVAARAPKSFDVPVREVGAGGSAVVALANPTERATPPLAPERNRLQQTITPSRKPAEGEPNAMLDATIREALDGDPVDGAATYYTTAVNNPEYREKRPYNSK